MKLKYFYIVICVFGALLPVITAKVIYENPAIINLATDFSTRRTIFDDLLRRRCPLCDSSVYGYCSEKLFHDSCCCHNSNNPFDTLPYECQYVNCNFLYSNSCREHKLISACCCTDSNNYNNYLFYK